jgi:hypothetical protein
MVSASVAEVALPLNVGAVIAVFTYKLPLIATSPLNLAAHSTPFFGSVKDDELENYVSLKNFELSGTYKPQFTSLRVPPV